VKSGIYQIRNQLNSKRYVGSAVNLRRRQRAHFGGLRRGTHSNRHLQNAYNKYGEAAFVFSILEIVENPANLIECEQHHMDTLKPEYNLSPTVGSPLGCHRSPETRRKISRGLKKDGKLIRARLRKELAQKLENLALLSRRKENEVIRLLIEDATLEQLGVRQPQEKPA